MTSRTFITKANQTSSLRGHRQNVPANMQMARQGVTKAIEFLKHFGFEKTLIDEMELALMEAVTNFVQHAPQFDPNHQVASLEILVSDKLIEIRIEDNNTPYGSKITEEFPDVDSLGGRGFPIMEMLMDDVRHIPLPHGNLLWLTKQIGIPASALQFETKAMEEEMNAIVEELMSCYESLTAFFKFGALLSESKGHDDFRDQLLNRLIQITHSDSCILRTLSPETGTLLNSWTFGEVATQNEISIDASDSPEAMCLQNLKDIWTQDQKAMPQPVGGNNQAHHSIQSVGLVHPLRYRSETFGTLWLQRKSTTPFSAAQVNMIHTFTDFLALRKASVKHQEEMLRIGKVAREMQIARDIQCSLLPPANIITDKLSIAGICQPAREVGGDYYDHIILSPNKILLVIADIMGKGIPAALFVAIFRSMVLSQKHLAEHPAKLATQVNQLCYEDLNRVGMFLTAQFCFLDMDKYIMRVANAGHWPLVYMDSTAMLSIAPDGLPIGVDVDFPFEESEVKLSNSFSLALYTDGIPEACNDEGSQFGAEGIDKWIRNASKNHLTPEQDINELLKEVANYNNAKVAKDDLSILMAKTK